MGMSNIFQQGVNARIGMSNNAASFVVTRGFNASVDKSFENVIDATVRYQTYRYTIAQVNDAQANQTLALDLFTSIASRTSLMVSIERMSAQSLAGYTFVIDLSRSF